MTDEGRRYAPGSDEVAAWLAQRIAEALCVSTEQIEVTTALADHGLSSREVVTLAGDLEAWLGGPIDPARLYESDSIASLAADLARSGASAAAPADGLETLVDVMRVRAARTPDRPVYTFLVDGESAAASLSYGALDRRARSVAATLLAEGASGDRVAVLNEPGLGFISGFFGCLYAGMVPVPAFPPLDRSSEHLAGILRDAQTRLLLTDAAKRAAVERYAARWLSGSVAVVAVDEVAAQEPTDLFALSPKPGDLALLQYTSGSTRSPRGVMVTHASLMANLRAIRDSGRMTPDDVGVSWLPPYHDLGLIGFLLTPMYVGGRVILMSPNAFLQRPVRWLRAISAHRGTLSGAPNFAFDYCVDRISREEREGLDLASWRLAYNGAEPVRPATLDRFVSAFGSNGFRRSAFLPGYGLAESTLMLCGSTTREAPVVVALDRAGLERGVVELTSADAEDAKLLVGCGETHAEHELRIVDPETRRPCPPGRIGEIWAAGASVAAGYWNRPEETRATFAAFLDDDRTGPFLRTGDLGFFHEGELVVAGRLRDLIIIRGRNHLPQDIEEVVRACHAAFASRPTAAFAVDREGAESLVVVQEVSRSLTGRPDARELGAAIAEAVSEALALKVAHAVLVAPGSIPITTSGKIRRGRCRQAYLEGTLERVAEWMHPTHAAQGGAEAIDAFPLSHGQQALWFLQRQQPSSATYNEVVALRVRGPLSPSALDAAFRALVRRHPALRCCHRIEGDEILQRPAGEISPTVEQSDLRGVDDSEALRRVAAAAAQPFDLERGRICRLHCFRRAADEHVILLVIHHIACDAASLRMLLDELLLLYEMSSDGREAQLEPVRGDFREFVLEERATLAGPPGERLRDYWRRRLAGELPGASLAPKQEQRTAAVRSHRFRLSARLGRELRARARERGVTLYVLLLSAFQALLHRYTGNEDVIVGTHVSTRGPRFRDVVGYFLNSLPIRTRVDPETSFGDLVASVDDSVKEAIRHQAYPFVKMVRDLNVVRDPRLSPVFQIMFGLLRPLRADDDLGALVLTQDPSRVVQRGALELGGFPLAPAEARFDLTLDFLDAGETLAGVVHARADLFPSGFVDALIAHLCELLEGVAADPDRSVGTLPVVTPEERRILLIEWNRTRRDYPRDRCVHQLVEEQVERIPRAVALVHGSECLTYRELDGKANALASRLVERGVGPGDFVPVLMGRGLEVPISFLAVMKTGAAFVPIDATWPRERISPLLRDVRPKRVLVDEAAAKGLAGVAAEPDQLMVVDWRALAAGAESPGLSVAAESPIYAMLTSGSTGTPKAAVNLHRGIVNRLSYMSRVFGSESNEVVLQFTDHVFDSAVWELFWPLTRAGRSIVPDWCNGFSVSALIDLIERERITMIDTIPSVFDLLVERFEAEPGQRRRLTSLRRVILGSEAIRPKAVARFAALFPDVDITNFYGPTETSIGTVAYEVPKPVPEAIPIGMPIDNVHAVICDRRMNPVPVGVRGTLFLGGDCVGRGYLNDPERTAQVFVANPFPELPGDVLYDTGDCARRLPDGNIEYLGRLDDQVKIHGFRIELGEVNAALSALPGVKESAVVRRTSESGGKLVGYLVPARGEAPDVGDLKRRLSERLPRYMVPSSLVLVDRLPLGPSGKVDVKALPEPSAGTEGRVAPRNELERWLAKVWAEVLEVPAPGVHDNFFDLGGASIQTLQVEARARAAGLRLDAAQIFELQTIAELAAVLGAEVEPADSRATRTLIESLGVHLPERSIRLEERLRGTRNPVRFPLRQMTGIESMPVVAEGQGSLDLARKAIEDCLLRSRHRPEDIDVLICCNISRLDAERAFAFEPSSASRLIRDLGFRRAIGFDVSNACAGMFTGIWIVDALLRTGAVRCGLVVSGEFISHLGDTAQKEIGEDFLDPRLPCLTLGDSGAALTLEASADGRSGFHELELFTLGRYSRTCIAKASDREHGGAIMLTDLITPSEARNLPAAVHARGLLERAGWLQGEPPEHVILHQTSATTLRDVRREVNRVLGAELLTVANTMNNLRERGNTATTSHFVALMDGIREGSIRSGRRVVFGVSGSGQVLGCGLYQLDDLPDRMLASRRRAHAPAPKPARQRTAAPRVRICAVATTPPTPSAQREHTGLARRAAEACLARWGRARRELELLVFAGVYRPDYLSEPAIASLLAGDLAINDSMESAQGRRTFCFDVMNGGVGFLNACHVATQAIAAGCASNAMIAASEVENNADHFPAHALGVAQTGSALILERAADGDAGFLGFCFRAFPEHLERRHSRGVWRAGKPFLDWKQAPLLEGTYVELVAKTVEEFLREEELEIADFGLVLAPLPGPLFAEMLAKALGCDRERLIQPEPSGLDYLSSALPVALEQALATGRGRPGDLALLVSVGSGIQVGCAIYRF